MKDFSKPRRQIQFKIDDDIFEAAPAIPAETLMEFATRFSDLESADQAKRVSILAEVLDLVLLPEAFSRMRARMSDRKNPVELDQLNEIIMWLLGEYGLRPTQASSGSPDGLDNQASGTNSTGAAQPLA